MTWARLRDLRDKMLNAHAMYERAKERDDPPAIKKWGELYYRRFKDFADAMDRMEKAMAFSFGNWRKP